MATLGDIANKAKATEEVRNKMKVQDDAQKSVLGKRSYVSCEPRKFEAGSGLDRTRGQFFRRHLHLGKAKIKGQHKLKLKQVEVLVAQLTGQVQIQRPSVTDAWVLIHCMSVSGRKELVSLVASWVTGYHSVKSSIKERLLLSLLLMGPCIF